MKATGIKIYPNVLADLRRAEALGLLEVAQAAWQAGSDLAPRRTPRLFETGGWVAFADGARVGGNIDVTPADTGAIAVAYATWDFPGHLVELGTVDTPAQPFAVPGALSVTSNVPALVAKGMAKGGFGKGAG